MDAVDDLIGRFDQDIVVETAIDPALQNAAERALAETLAQKGEKLGVGEGALVAMTPDGARARARRRQQLRREPVQPRRRRQAPARLGVQAVRLSHRARARAHARHGARGRADHGEGLAAGKLRARISRPGDPDAGARQFAQHRRRAPDAWSSGRRRSFAPRYRLGINSLLAAQCLDRARHLGSLADRACLRLCAVRQRRLCHRAACGRARALERRQAAVCAADAGARPHRRCALTSR